MAVPPLHPSVSPTSFGHSRRSIACASGLGGDGYLECSVLDVACPSDGCSRHGVRVSVLALPGSTAVLLVILLCFLFAAGLALIGWWAVARADTAQPDEARVLEWAPPPSAGRGLSPETSRRDYC